MSDNTERSPAELILAHQKRIDDVNDDGLGTPRNTLEYVQDVYKCRMYIDPWRFRAAVAALPFESLKLSASAIVSRYDFDAMLDRFPRVEAERLPRSGRSTPAQRRAMQLRPRLVSDSEKR